MKIEKFLSEIIGVPWSDRACSFDKTDCWGLVVLYYRHVKGIELHHVEGYESGADFVTCHDDVTTHWQSVEHPVNDSMVTFYHGEKPVHVGILISPGKVLHSRGDNGTVRIDSLLAMMRVYSSVGYMVYAEI